MPPASSCESQPQPLLNNREEVSFGDFYLRRYNQLVANFLEQGIPPDDCEDQAQETLLRVLPRWEHIDSSRNGDWRFANTIAINVGKDYLKASCTRRLRV